MHRLTSSSPAKSLFTKSFYSILIAIWIYLIGLSLNPSLQRVTMEKMHLRTSFFPAWMILQTIPSMYNFANEIWVSSSFQSFSDIQKNSVSHIWMNHYPLRLLTFALSRDQLFLKYDGPIYIYIRSQYRGTSLESEYQFFWNEKTSDSRHRILALLDKDLP